MGWVTGRKPPTAVSAKRWSKTSGFLAGIGEIRKRDIPANWDAAIDSRYIRDAAVAAQ
ncbi:Uncharacterised protein [Raoultella planticola]|uniref:Uncharacterized protein n=1 Tax=Raoultella planticola TaxID=575 RepID=A0A485AQ21_RAOPL|nr:Uncharacterised protein [Raoultella planticola]